MAAKILVLVLALALAGLLESASIEQLDDQPSQITVKSLGGATRLVDLDGERDTVATLKAKIAELSGGQADRLRVVFAGRVLDDDTHLLSECGIRAGSTVIYLERKAPPAGENKVPAKQETQKIKLAVKSITGARFELSVGRKSTVGLLRQAIGRKLEVEPGAIRLISNGIVLEDNSKSLAECELQDGSTVMVALQAAAPHAETVEGPPAEPKGDQRPPVRAIELNGNESLEEIIDTFLGELNREENMISMLTAHDPKLANAQLVQRAIEQSLIARIMSEQPFGPFTEPVLKSAKLLVRFGYEHDGERQIKIANLREGAEWIAERAQAILDREKSVGSQSSTTIAPSV